MADESVRAGLPAFVVYSVLAGGNAVGVRFSNFELEPFWGATFRFLLAAALMLIVMAAGRYSFPRGRELLGSIVYGVFAFGGAFAFAFYALVELEAGFGQIVLAVVPLATLLLGAIQGLETITATSVGGAPVAVAGVAVIRPVCHGQCWAKYALSLSLAAASDHDACPDRPRTVG